ncbi:MAG: dTMP kinase [Armatimonadota bacterium]|nr:dTMP kinase [bacterium]
MRKGFFLTIEGVEGAGKSTLAERIANVLRACGREVIVTMEPGGCELGVRVRQLVLDSANVISDRAELLLFEAARAQHVDETILPALSCGAVVICDRFADSSLAYQGYARGIDPDMVRTLNDFAASGLVPDLTILLDLPVDKGLARQNGVDRVSSEGVGFHESVRQGYLALAKAEPDRFVIIDATESIDKIVKRALEVIE